MSAPDWQLPDGVDRGLRDYFRAADMVADYEAQVAASPLAAADLRLCERVFAAPGPLVDLGCGTGRLARHFAARGFAVTGVDLSDAMLAEARRLAAGAPVEWVRANLVGLAELADASFDYAACLFSTLGMVRGAANREAALESFARVLKPGGALVLHAHNVFYPGLGARRVWRQRWLTLTGSESAGDITMPQAYAGAPLTLHHFRRDELWWDLADAGFRVEEMHGVGVGGELRRARGAYGFLAVARRGG